MSCLFRSLSYFVQGMNENYLRSIICDFLEKNPIIFDNVSVNNIVNWSDGMNINEYIQNMRLPNTWGSALEISVFCNIFNSKVIVHHNGKEIEFLPKNSDYKYICHLIYTGNHYEPLKP
jgi:hypothetical protein